MHDDATRALAAIPYIFADADARLEQLADALRLLSADAPTGEASVAVERLRKHLARASSRLASRLWLAEEIDAAGFALDRVQDEPEGETTILPFAPPATLAVQSWRHREARLNRTALNQEICHGNEC